MRKLLWAITAFLAVLSFSACKKKNKASEKQDSTKAKESAAPILRSETGVWPTPWWTAKAKVTLRSPAANLSFNMSIRAEQGKTLWFSANAFGLMEVARGIVTPDSVMALDKFNNRCYTGGTQSLGNYVPFQMELAQLQHFLMGRVFWDSLGLNQMRHVGDSTYVDGFQDDTQFSVATWQKYFLHRAHLNQNSGQTTLNLENSDFRLVGDTKIGFRKLLNSKQIVDKKEEKSSLEIEFTRFEFVAAKPEMPLDLPSDCERQAIR